MLIMIKPKQILAAVLLSILAAVSCTSSALASQATSSHYGVSEVEFGAGGELNACSSAYCAKLSAGETGIGNTKSASFQVQGGLNSEREPLLAVAVTGSPIDLGIIDATATSSGSTTFNVKSYLASGYTVSVSGQTPSSANGHVLTPMASADIARPGLEQFGINLRQNTTPAIGADPVQVPSSVFSFGAAATGYNTANNFKYVNGDTIAQSGSSSGETDYTMSMIANVATTTPSGVYGGRLILNVIPTF